jgi:16S rRNA processing protein RimM
MLGKPNGLDGHIGIYIEPEDLGYLEPGVAVLVGDRELTVRSLRPGNKGPQVAFTEITSRSQAESIRGSEVRVAQRRQLADSEFWPSDLVGLEVRPGGGVVTGVNHGVAQDRLEIERAGIRFEVPFVEEFVPVVDIEAAYVEVVEIEGLIQQSDPE